MGERLAPRDIAPRSKLLTRAECRCSENDPGCLFEKTRNGSAAEEHIGLAKSRYEIDCQVSARAASRGNCRCGATSSRNYAPVPIRPRNAADARMPDSKSLTWKNSFGE